MHLCDSSRGSGWNGRHCLLIFQLENRLFLSDLIAFFDEQIYDGARIGTFTEMRKFHIHKRQSETICDIGRGVSSKISGRARQAGTSVNSKKPLASGRERAKLAAYNPNDNPARR